MHNFFKKYFFINSFEPKLIECQDKNTIIIFRNYNDSKILKHILSLKNYCKKNGRQLFLANNVKLALKLRLNGAYIPSFNKDFSHLSFNFKKNFKLIGSAHNIKEINIKKKQGIKEIFLSSIFKKNNNYLGIYKFNNIKKNSKFDYIALGGINNGNLNKIKFLNVKGIAGISLFKKKGPSKRGLKYN